MKTKLLLLILLFCASIQSNAQNFLPTMKSRPADYEYLSAPDSLGVRHQLLMPSNTNKNVLAAQNLPYPIIFIHGLNSSSDTWIDMGTNLVNKGLSFGGRIDFCLNDDGNNYTSNKLVYPTTNADIALYTNYTTELTVADFYLLNFNIDNFGRLPNNSNFNDVLSNESAIAKQGVALKIAIQMVLLKTGRDKVVLMGHSMGGLAAREYIQNPSNWQADGTHHVAKLITTGTPHGGYTGTNAEVATGIDGQSEAYRDLRKSYSWTGYDGVYLYGGTENSSIIKNIWAFPFYNVDINCNGIDEDNTYITGLNYKTWRSSLDYSYIVGVCTNCSLLQGTIEGDGIVRSENANLSSFTNQTPLPAPKNEFIYTAAQTGNIGLHSELPQAIPVNMQGLDEPNEYSLSYGIEFNKTYKGFITQQPIGGYPVDFDEYKFIMPFNGTFSISATNSFSNNLPFQILDASFNVVYTNTILPFSTTSFSLTLTAGQYYLEFFATPTSTSYQYPYNFILSSALSTNTFVTNNSLNLFPNPTNSKVFFDNTNSNFNEVSIYNYLGQEVAKNSFMSIINNQEVDMSNLATGVYVLKFSTGDTSKSVKVIKQ
jgi:triacylglycerol esterase/lipase EstA (alpha/beta hydrolase family)